MKRFLLFNLLLFIVAFNSKAQDTTTVEKLVRYILQPLDKSLVLVNTYRIELAFCYTVGIIIIPRFYPTCISG